MKEVDRGEKGGALGAQSTREVSRPHRSGLMEEAAKVQV